MLSKFIVAACFAAQIAAEMGEDKEVAALNKATSGNFLSAGVIGEWKGAGEDDGTVWESIAWWIWFDTKNEAGEMVNGSKVQTFAQWEDEEAPGTYYSMTCTASFDPAAKVAADRIVDSYVGSPVDTKSVTSGKWGDIGLVADSNKAIEEKWEF